MKLPTNLASGHSAATSAYSLPSLPRSSNQGRRWPVILSGKLNSRVPSLLVLE